ncbi:MAG TPA: hypothetical protein VNX22_10310 [Acidobacteriaceae bacterium]|nr:hypothetical protein [Acidobacteriaceae bacterium]
MTKSCSNQVRKSIRTVSSLRARSSVNEAGKGAEGRVEGAEAKVVSPGFLRGQNIDLTDKRVEPLHAPGPGQQL